MLKRVLFYPLVCLLLLIAVLFSVVFLPGIPSWVFQVGHRYLPETIRIESVDGAFSGPLKINKIEYKQDDVTVKLESVSIDWRPSCLLRSRLCLDRIALQGVEVDLPLSSEVSEPPDEPFDLMALAEFKLPISIHLLSFQLDDFTLKIADHQYPVDQLQLSAKLDSSLSIDSLRLMQGGSWMNWQANLNPQDHFSLSSQLEWFVEPTLIEQLITQHASLGLTAPLSGELRIKGDLSELEFTFRQLFTTEDTGPVAATLDARVSLNEQQLFIDQFHLDLVERKGEVALSGQVTQWLDPHFDVTLQVLDITYPIEQADDTPILVIPSADLSLLGRLSDYTANLTALISGRDIPSSTLALVAEGNTAALNNFRLDAAIFDGKVRVQGSLRWDEILAWDTRVSIENLNPNQWSPELSGSIHLELSTLGTWEAQAPQFSLSLEKLSGLFQNQPLSGQGEIHYAADHLDIKQMDIRLGSTQLGLQGEMLNQDLGIKFDLKSSDLALIYPGLFGQVGASGELRGPLEAPSITASIQAEAIGYDAYEVAQGRGEVQVDFSGAKQSNLFIALDGIRLAGESLDRVELRLQGQPEQHQINLSAKGALLNIASQVSGRFNIDSLSYVGSLNDLSLERREIGAWQLQNSPDFSLSTTQFNLGELCLAQSQALASLCLSASRQANRTLADIRLTELSLRLLDPYLDAAQIESKLNLSLQFSQQGHQAPSAQILLTTTPGRLITPNDQPDFNLDPLHIQASLNGDRLDAEIATLFTDMDGELTAKLTLDQLSNRQNLSGEIALQLNELHIISALIPNLQEMEGKLQGRFNLAGSLAQPVIRGRLDLLEGAADLPAQGIRLSPLTLSLRSEGEEGEVMILEGLVGSGPGELRLSGRYNLASLTGSLRLQGENFEAMATEINLHISPDLAINVDDAIRVGGSVTIPYAQITPPRQQAQNAIRASEDVVFVGDADEELTSRNLPLLTDIEVILGDAVTVEAFGFNGRLLGRIRIQDDGTSATRASGRIQVEQGDYRLFGQNMTIQRGSFIFSGGPIDNPGLDLRVSRTIDTVEAGARIVGTLVNPEFTLFSTPAMPDSSVMSYLVLGRGPGEASSAEQSMMLQAAMALSMQGGNTITNQLREELNLDEFGFDTDDSGSSAFFIGKYLTPRLYIRYGVSLLESVEVLTLSYRLTSMWKVEAQSSSLGSGADFFYTRER